MIQHENKISLIQIVAALLIVNHHTGILKIPYLSYFTKGGFVVNTIFVYLSGYLLAKSYKYNIDKSYYKFFERRCLKIYPSLHISLIFIIIIYLFIGNNFSLNTLLVSLTGFQYFFSAESFGPQMWFISIILTCYFLFIPTVLFIKKNALYFYSILLFILIIIMSTDVSNINLYDKVNNIPVYRLFYHYIIFTIGLHLAILEKDIELFNLRTAYFVFIISLFTHILVNFIPFLSIIKILTDIFMAFSLLTLISESFYYFNNFLPEIMKLSTITYEIYLIHVAVIYFLNYIAPEKFYTYPLVFIISIALALIIFQLALYYKEIIKLSLPKSYRILNID
jgi:peptidoglycan/LPS O-acetylase OafA/YrhL